MFMQDENADSIEDAAVALASGLPVVFPTDTVYGLGVAVGKAETPEVLYDIKRRDHGKPVAWLVADPSALDTYGEGVSATVHDFARRFWPGALTLIVKASANVPRTFQSVEGTIALRMPACDFALDLIRRVGVPIATTSANISGQKAPQVFSELDEGLLGRVSVAVCDDADRSGVASTVIDCTTAEPILVREGGISMAEILGSDQLAL